MDRHKLEPKPVPEIIIPIMEESIQIPPPTKEAKAELEELCLQCWLEGGDI